jgi:hypothetical protein
MTIFVSIDSSCGLISRYVGSGAKVERTHRAGPLRRAVIFTEKLVREFYEKPDEDFEVGGDAA